MRILPSNSGPEIGLVPVLLQLAADHVARAVDVMQILEDVLPETEIGEVDDRLAIAQVDRIPDVLRLDMEGSGDRLALSSGLEDGAPAERERHHDMHHIGPFHGLLHRFPVTACEREALRRDKLVEDRQMVERKAVLLPFSRLALGGDTHLMAVSDQCIPQSPCGVRVSVVCTVELIKYKQYPHFS